MRVALAVVLGLACFAAGRLLGRVGGVHVGAFNARIDLCDDDASGRFISDAAASASCDAP